MKNILSMNHTNNSNFFQITDASVQMPKQELAFTSEAF